MTHPVLQLVYITDTNMTSVPEGLLSATPPVAFYDLEISGTNLSAIPDTVEVAWAQLRYLFVERAPQISTFPEVIGRLPNLGVVSLASDSITSIPDSALTDNTFFQLMLTNNPINVLPASVGRLSIMRTLGCLSTNISELPAAWLEQNSTPGAEGLREDSRIVLQAFETPLCRDWLPLAIQNGQAIVRAADAADVGWFRVRCSRGSPPYHYPLDQELQLRERNRE
ncbi:hypothetical protein P43SY_004235 [Pythium insidiosum]|uniref:Leucine-rich repeat domain-containing protein n=1 Tax=Pythium insidiosum TaxID=114742 RepID=A0AAD5LWM9_PYTIN|nr:hypothetical protein P43SY_004235 [Pythium insidiosum]